MTYEVGGASSPPDAFQRHPGHEWGYVLSGRLQVRIGFDEYVLEPGDAISINSSIPHRLATIGDEPVQAIWFVLGRAQFDAQTLIDDHLTGRDLTGGDGTTRRSRGRATVRSLARPLIALVAIALVFRPQIIAIGPLLPSIQAGLGISHGVAGALSAIPVLCMGIFAPLAPVAGSAARGALRRWRPAPALVIGFGLLRLAVPVRSSSSP